MRPNMGLDSRGIGLLNPLRYSITWVPGVQDLRKGNREI